MSTKKIDSKIEELYSKARISIEHDGYTADDESSDIEDYDSNMVAHIRNFLSNKTFDAKMHTRAANVLFTIAECGDYAFNESEYDYSLSSIKNEYDSDLANAVKKLRSILKTAWDELHNSASKSTGSRRRGGVKTRAKKIATNVIVRKTSRKLTKDATKAISGLMQSHPLLQVAAPHLQTEMGQAAVMALLCVSLEFLPRFLPLPESITALLEPYKDLIIGELEDSAADKLSEPLEKLAVLLLPALQQALVPLLSSGDIKKLEA